MRIFFYNKGLGLGQRRKQLWSKRHAKNMRSKTLLEGLGRGEGGGGVGGEGDKN